MFKPTQVSRLQKLKLYAYANISYFFLNLKKYEIFIEFVRLL